ncbi:MAG: endo-1,4-beta-xylanase [Croceibacterium sp.]
MSARGKEEGSEGPEGYTRRSSLAVGLGMLATACGGGSSGGSPSPAPTPAPAPTTTPTPAPTPAGSIAAAAAAKNMKFGSAFNWDAPGADAGSFNNPNYATLLERDCNILVPENELKWEGLRPTSSTFNYTQADQMVAYARSKGMEIRGHTLLWYVEERFPTWLENYDYGVSPRAEAERLIREHVTQVASHFAADITSWDVINEAIDNGTGNLRQHSMSAAVGGDASLLDLAFETARDVLPGAELVYNDFMDWGSTAHRNGVLNLLRGFRDRNVPVDTLGIQSHIGFYSAGTAQSIVDAQRPAMEAWLDEIVALGYRLKITEMDINDRNRAGTLAQRDADGAILAKGWLDMLMAYPQLDEVLVWGMCDKYSWLQGFAGPRPDGTPIRAAPYDDLFQPKPLRTAYMEAFQNTSARPA